MNRLGLEIGTPAHGWVEIVVFIDGCEFERIDASYISATQHDDCLTLLADLTSTLESNVPVEIDFFLEPALIRLKFETDKSAVSISRAEFSDSQHAKPGRGTYTPLGKFKLSQVNNAIVNAFFDLGRRIDRESFQESWGYPFPEPQPHR